MGADIAFSDRTYYRDSYNTWNLAWVTGKSYWANKGTHIAFMRALSKTTDKQIREYVEKCVDENKIERPSQMNTVALDMERHLKEKRDMLVALFKKNPKVKVTMWSV